MAPPASKEKDYWEGIKALYRSLKGSKVEIILLGGVDWNYMKWLYQESDLLLFRMKDLGFRPLRLPAVDLPLPFQLIRRSKRPQGKCPCYGLQPLE